MADTPIAFPPGGNGVDHALPRSLTTETVTVDRYRTDHRSPAGSCHADGGVVAIIPNAPLVALIGQPNVGKSTVFNMLTGLSQHVGNWPGKTVEQKVGTYQQNGVSINLVDLPGTYSLTANSEEERIARDYLIQARPDVVIAVVNAAQLERNLYLVAELLCLPTPVVLGLNMLDVAEQHGTHVEPSVLAAALNVPVVPLVATRNQGVKQLMDRPWNWPATPGCGHPTGRSSGLSMRRCSRPCASSSPGTGLTGTRKTGSR